MRAAHWIVSRQMQSIEWVVVLLPLAQHAIARGLAAAAAAAAAAVDAAGEDDVTIGAHVAEGCHVRLAR